MRGGVSLVEILIAVAVLGAALFPVVSMANHNLEMLRAERARMQAEALCHDTLERLGRSQSYAAAILTPSPNPSILIATDPWNTHPDLFASMGYPGMHVIATQAKLHMSISLERTVAPELDLLNCEVSWVSDGWTKKSERFRYSRFLTYGHMPQPR